MGAAAFSLFPWYQTATFAAFMLAALVGMIVSGRRTLVAIVAAMLFITLIDPVLSLFMEM